MKSSIKYVWIQTIPVMCGYLFLGTAFGLLLQKAGYSWKWALAISLFIYAGSMQFMLVSLLSAGASVFTTAVMTLFINSRHIFYGLSFLEKFHHMGKKRLYMIFSLTDETYSLLCSQKTKEGTEQRKEMFLIALLNQIYWIIGSVIGAVAGSFLTVDLTGIDFSMTALFIVIFVEQWKENESHIPAWIGIGCGMLCFLLIGAEHFLLPALLAAACFLVLLKKRLNIYEKDGRDE